MSHSSIAHAKINLFLHVTGRRDDGYHFLESLVVFSEFGDLISASPKKQDFTLDVSGPFAGELSNTPDNLTLKAAREFHTACQDKNIETEGVHLQLVKNLPVASGVGGGSADAAATLRLLAKLWPRADEILDQHDFTDALGADIMMCLKSKPLIASGVGENVEMIKLPSLWLVLINPGIAISTPKVFEQFQMLESSPNMPPQKDFNDAMELASFLKCTRNDLLKPTLKIAPIINDVLSAIQQSGDCLYANMSGSGATCFGLYPNQKTAQTAASKIQTAQPNWWCVATNTLDEQ